MIKQAEFVTSIVSHKNIPNDGRSHILLLGRSNVGKSSMINAITNRKSLARVSQTPGKTITLNLYLINQSIYLVDAPGYGYAKRSKVLTKDFLKMIRDYIEHHQELKKIFLLMDYNVGPTVDDIAVYDELLIVCQQLGIELIVVLTKYDKCKPSMRYKREKEIKEKLLPNQKIYITSSEKKLGVNELIKEVLE